MSGPRGEVKALRAGIAAALIAASTAAGARVYPHRISSLGEADAADGPALAIYTPADNQDRVAQSPVYQARQDVQIMAIVPSELTDEAAADALDDLLDEIGAALFADDLEGTGATDVERIESIRISTGPGRSEDGRTLWAVGVADFTVARKAIYYPAAATLDALSSIHTDIDVSPADTTAEVQLITGA